MDKLEYTLWSTKCVFNNLGAQFVSTLLCCYVTVYII